MHPQGKSLSLWKLSLMISQHKALNLSIAVGLLALALVGISYNHKRFSVTATPLPTHSMYLPYYSIKDSWQSELTLNNAGIPPLAVSVILYSLNGQTVELPQISVPSNGTAVVRIEEAISKFQQAVGKFNEGSLEVRFTSADPMALGPQLTILNPERRVSFDLEPPMGLKTSKLEGLWWSLNDQTDGQIMLCNTKEYLVESTLEIAWKKSVVPGPSIKLSPHQTILLDINELLRDSGIDVRGIECGGLSINHNGEPGALIAFGMIEDKKRGFASSLNFIDTKGQPTSTLDGTGLLIGSVASLGNTSKGGFFIPTLTLKNTASTGQVVEVTLTYEKNEKQESLSLPGVALDAREVRTIDFKRITDSLGKAKLQNASLNVSYSGEEGSIIGAMASIDQAGSRVVDVPLVSRKENSGKGGNHPFRIDDGFRSVAYLTNITEKPTKILAGIFHEGGMYTPEWIDVAPGGTVAIDFLELRQSQTKDVQERTLPIDLKEGQFFWTPRGTGALIGRIVMIDENTGAVSNFSCPNCCQLEPFSLVATPDPVVGSPGGTRQMSVSSYETYCGQYTMGPYNVTSSVSYSSTNSSVMSVNSTGNVNFVSTGTASINLSLFYQHSDYISAEDCGLFDAYLNGSCPGFVVTVQLQKLTGATWGAVPNPLRVGISTTIDNITHDRRQSLRAIVSPASQASNIAIGVSSKLQKSDVSADTSTGIVTFKVVGVSPSDNQGDSTLTINHSGTSVITAPVTVVVPYKIATPHDTTGGGVIVENRALNITTSPALPNIPANQFMLMTVYLRNLTISVLDKWNNPVGDLYQGAEITEGVSSTVIKINQFLTSSSTYSDPVGFGEGTTVVNANDPMVTAWPSQPKIPLRNGTQSGTQNLAVFVDGFRLNPDPAISNRVVTGVGNGNSVASPPVSVTILWP